MLINPNQQLEEQLLLGKLQLPQSQFARQAGAAAEADGVWKRKMNLPAAGVTRPRCVLPSWPSLRQKSLFPQQPGPVIPHTPPAPPPPLPSVAAAAQSLLLPLSGEQPSAGGQSTGSCWHHGLQPWHHLCTHKPSLLC